MPAYFDFQLAYVALLVRFCRPFVSISTWTSPLKDTHELSFDKTSSFIWISADVKEKKLILAATFLEGVDTPIRPFTNNV